MDGGNQSLAQEDLIERVRVLSREDDRLVAALMYGSWVVGEGDAFSDIEFILYFADEADSAVDREAWVGRVAPVELYFVNEFGAGTAIFSNLIRGEFHFDRASDIAGIDAGWREYDWFPSLDAAIVLDRTGELTRRLRAIAGPPPARGTPDRMRFLCHSFVNWLLFGWTVLERGELARALDILGHVQRYLLWLVRLREGATDHWPTPSRAVELDISSDAYGRYAACTSFLEAAGLRAAYRSAWHWGKEVMESLPAGLAAVPDTLVGKLDRRLDGQPE